LAWRALAGGGGRPAPSLDDHLALATLGLLLALIWGAALWDLTGGRRAAPDDAERGDSQWAIALRHFRRNRLAVAGLFLIVGFYLIALLAPLLTDWDPTAQQMRARLAPPSAEHPLGSDGFGRDVLSRILYGARISLAIGFIATAISITIGTTLGAIAGYFGGKVDALIMRFTDLVLAFPRLILLIMIVALFSPSLLVIIVVLGLTQWPGTTRIVRGDVLSLREREFIQAARALGMGSPRIILRHVVPNVLAPVIVTATLGIGNTIVLEAGLSFLGMGVQPPTPTWGSMVAEGRDTLLSAWWIATFPGLVIVLVVLAFNLMGDGLRDALDPRLRT
jgi:peptide/nickel transport system permease protein